MPSSSRSYVCSYLKYTPWKGVCQGQILKLAIASVRRESPLVRLDSVIVEKCKTNPSIRKIHMLYKKVYGILLQYVFRRYKAINKIMIFADVVPDSKKRKDIEKGIKETLSEIVDTKTIKYHILFTSSIFSYGLQAVDYCCWAQKKK